MDETNTANSSAKLAASAASSKQLADAPTTNTKSSTHVKLLIKSSNQQYDDQVIESDLSWTVRKLKVHLSVVYPNKPVSTSEFYLGIPIIFKTFGELSWFCGPSNKWNGHSTIVLKKCVMVGAQNITLPTCYTY